MGAKASSASVISLPKGGGALSGMGEKFSPDLHTGTGNFTIPLAVPAGRNGFQPQLNLVYSTGNGNGPFGLGWSLSVPGVSRKTSSGLPRYDESKDVFVLSGAEDLVPMETTDTTTRYRPRTEGLFARILYHRDATNSHWEVRSKDGLVSHYGTPKSFGTDPATIADPSDRTKVFAWKLTRTEDPFGNRIDYEYERDSAEEGPHHWDQLNLTKIRYVDHGDNPANPRFLVTVEFLYEERPDPHSGYRSGFEIRTRKRCSRILVHTHADKDQQVRSYDLVYLDERPELTSPLPSNGVSLLSQIRVTGYDGAKTESLPPVEFGYTRFDPERRDFVPLQGSDLPAQSLASPNLELVDLFGNGLPDFLEMAGTVRYWRNLGGGRFDLPRFMKDAPAGLALADTGVQFIDANGDGRTDLLVTTPGLSGYFPLNFNGQWDRRSFQRYRQAPSFGLEDPEVKLVDLDGDGITDAIRSGSRMECFFNDPKEGWNSTRQVERRALEVFPNVNFSDPRVKWADITGDGLQDIVLVYDANVEYWPNLGYGDWGKRIHMENSPRFPYGYDPRRILIGDVDGDGLADIVYVSDTKVTLWMNQSGNRWSDPITILGTPPVSDIDAVRLVDVLGAGIGGLLWSRDATGSSPRLFFLDFTGGSKPYLLHEMDNHIGAITKVEYAPSTRFYLEDQKLPATRWNTTLPFPVHVVSRVEVIDHFSKGKLTTEYRYHYGYWDGAEREFRGFGMVEQLDTEGFDAYDGTGLHGAQAPFAKVARQYFSPATLSKTWFHQGPVGDEYGDWQELDRSDQYWVGDPQVVKHTDSVNHFLRSWPPTPDGRRVKRDALRALRGSVLRTELYALDGLARRDRPYTVVESGYSLTEVEPSVDRGTHRSHIFFPHCTSQRTTQWERGDDPLTQFAFTRYTDKTGTFDPFGRPLSQAQIACPRGWRTIDQRPAEAYLATYGSTVYAEPSGAPVYIHNRVARTTSFEIVNTGGRRVADLAAIEDRAPELKLIGQTLSYYDGDAFVGLPLGQVGKFGAVTRTESLVLTEEILHQAYGTEIPPYLESTGNPTWTNDYPLEFRALSPRRAGYTFHAGSADPAEPRGYYANTDRRRYDFQSPLGSGRGLVLEVLGPLNDEATTAAGHRTLIANDKFDLLPEQVTDAAGLTTEAKNDYRVLQPAEVTDPNGNKSSFVFSPLGLLAGSFVRGKTSSEGDQSRPSVRMEVDLLAFENSPPENRQPILVRTIRHVHHDTEMDVPLPERDGTITSVEYSDGFGRLLQTRMQGEEVRFGDEHFGGGESVVPARQSDGAGGEVIGSQNTDEANPNVVVSGWQTYDNKGRVVEKYEPFFSEGWGYAQPGDTKTGQKVAMFYDPRGRVTRTLNPDASELRVVCGVPGTIAMPDVSQPDTFEPTPWEVYTYDVNDNAGRTHPTSSFSYQHHWNTPASVLIDALGRPVQTTERNRDPPAAVGAALPVLQDLCTRMTYDIRGNVLSVTDAVGRLAFTYLYDYAKNNLGTDSIDAGRRRAILDAIGGVIEQRDSKGAWVLYAYDGLNRPLRLWARDGKGQKLGLRGRVEYGDAGLPGQPVADRASNRSANRLGYPFKEFDEAGLLSFDAYDFKGNLLEKVRRVIDDSAILASFDGPPPGWTIEPFRVDWTNPGDVTLDAKTYASAVSYDCLNRAKSLTCPEDVENKRRQIFPRYNRAGSLEHIALDRDTFVERIAYDAKGQRVLIAYGNGIMTRHSYDSRTARLLRLRTERFEKHTDLTYRRHGDPLQDLGYDYDLSGNILAIHDRTPGSGIKDSSMGLDALDRTFIHDALYRLRSATGRESDRPTDIPWDGVPRSSDPTKTRTYSEHYLYDLAGNIKALTHLAAGGFMRAFDLAPRNNRLRTMTIGVTAFDYQYDDNGNLTAETTSRHFEWDHGDRMRVFRTQTAASEPTVYAHYLYDTTGQRVKKLVRKQGGQVDVTVYIDRNFEYQRVDRAGNSKENSILHVVDDRGRVAALRVGQPLSGGSAPSVTYQLADHIGNSNVVVGGAGAAASTFINREEYTAFGESSFGGFDKKRYRFGGKERDEESGLQYFGARYFAASLGRWLSCDPAGTVDGQNLYVYVRNNPTRFSDSAGKESADPQVQAQKTGDVWVLPEVRIVGCLPQGAVDAPEGGLLGSGPMPGPPSEPMNMPGGTGARPFEAPGGIKPDGFGPGSYQAPPKTIQVPAEAPGLPTEAVVDPAPALPRMLAAAGQVLAGVSVVVGAGLTFAGDVRLRPRLEPTSAQLDAIFVRTVTEQNAILGRHIAEGDFSMINITQNNRLLDAAMHLANFRPDIALRLLNMAYGRALETMVGDALDANVFASGYFERLGGPSRADFRGLGPLGGALYDITTEAQRQAHVDRTYGPKLRIVTYQRHL